MPRFGQNPLKTSKAPLKPPAEITVGVLNFIPDQAGYFQGQLDSLKLCLSSIRANADQPFDLLVVDNGSCAEVRTYLHNELISGHIDYLILNKCNIGKANAVLQILGSAPGDLIFYSDGDIYYRPNWMLSHLNLLRAFPKAGFIGGWPARQVTNYCTKSTFRWVDENNAQLKIEKGNLIPDEWSWEFYKSTGGSDISMNQYLESLHPLEDCRITSGEVTVYIGAGHMQYLIPHAVVSQLPHQRFNLALDMSEDTIIDKAVDEAGFLRLSTNQPYVYHIGNKITEEWLVDEFKRLVQEIPKPLSVPARRRHWFFGRSKVRNVIKQIYQWAFDIYYQNT